MKPPIDCQQPAFHEMHLCILRHLDEAEAKKLSTAPQYRCRRCDQEANRAKNLCSPQKL